MCLGVSLLVGWLSGAAFAASGAVTPDAITHNQRVHVTWSGMSAGKPIFVQQCDNVINANPTAFDETIDCSSLSQQAIDGQTFNASGSGQTNGNLATDPDFNAFVGLEPSTFLGWGCEPSGTPTGVADASGNQIYNPCTIRVSDNAPDSPTNSFFLTLNMANPSGTAPAFTADSPPTTVATGSPFSYTFAASGSPAPTFNWVFGTAGPFLTLNTTTGVLSGTPTLPGSYTFRVQADNAAGSVQSAVHTLVVGSAGQPPAFTADTPPSSATVGTPYTYTYAATGAPAPTFTVTSGTLPTGLSLDATSGVVSGTPTTAGTFTFTVAAANGVGAPAVSPSAAVTVGAGQGGGALKVTGVRVSGFASFSLRAVIATFSDPDRQAPSSYTASVDWGDGTHETATVVQSGRGRYRVLGVHRYARAGTYSIVVSVHDSDGTSGSVTSTARIRALPWWAFVRNLFPQRLLSALGL
jgi:Putative Ig domain/PKD domain